MKHTKLPCGCVHQVDPEKVLTWCPEHYATWAALHAQALEDYRRTASPDPSVKSDA